MARAARRQRHGGGCNGDAGEDNQRRPQSAARKDVTNQERARRTPQLRTKHWPIRQSRRPHRARRYRYFVHEVLSPLRLRSGQFASHVDHTAHGATDTLCTKYCPHFAYARANSPVTSTTPRTALPILCARSTVPTSLTLGPIRQSRRPHRARRYRYFVHEVLSSLRLRSGQFASHVDHTAHGATDTLCTKCCPHFAYALAESPVTLVTPCTALPIHEKYRSFV